MRERSRLLRKLNRKINDKGSAIVVVIIAMAFIGILASVLMYMSLLNYQMKVNNLKAKDNFYSAETVFDQIRMGMEGDVSDSLQNVYNDILLNYNNMSESDQSSRVRYYFLTNLQKKYAVKSDSSTYDPARLFSYLTTDVADKTVFEVTYRVAGSPDVIYQLKKDSTSGTILGGIKNDTDSTHWEAVVDASGNVVADPGFTNAEFQPKGNLTLYEDGIALRRLKVIYTDNTGYVSVIESDLRIKTPEVYFSKSTTLPSLNGISLVAGKTLQVVPAQITADSANVIRGSFYANKMIVGSETAGEATGTTLRLEEDSVNPNRSKRMVVREGLVLGQGAELSTDEYGEFWAGTITMNGAYNGDLSKISFLGNDVYVAGDLALYGKQNIFRAGTKIGEEYSGQYIGFGNGQTLAEKQQDSSAIIINGTDSELYLNELQNLTLAGNSYIALQAAEKKQQETMEALPSPKPSIVNSGIEDIMMGQSVAVKSDQLAYLVPAECIGIDSNGTQVLSNPSNPIMLEQYDSYIKGKTDVTEVAFNISCKELGGRTLADYGVSEANIQKYFQRVNSKITLVYYYVAFDSDTDTQRVAANQYFKDYYKANSNTMNAYASLYSNAIRIRNVSDGAYIMHLAGNIVETAADGSRSLREDTYRNDLVNSGYQNSLEADYEKYQALCLKMIDDYTLLNVEEQRSDVFNNLVNTEKLRTFYGVIQNKQSDIYFEDGNTYTDVGGGTYQYKAVITNGDYTYDGSAPFRGLIIATGDVTVEKNFRGTILAGGNITIRENVEVQPDEDALLYVMKYAKDAGSSEYHVTDFLKGGDGYLSSDDTLYQSTELTLGELITYENWKKE